MKKTLHCDGHLKRDDDKSVLCLTGDKRQEVKEFFIKYKIIEEHNIIVHGF